ncbi:MAG: hypothetical protein ABI378_12135 [Chitinophagaceae bacterium]
MENKISFVLLIILLSNIFYSCKKSENNSCRTPFSNEIQGAWKQDYRPNPNAYLPQPNWERIEFRSDSFYMQYVAFAELLTPKDCFQSTWKEYTKGIYRIDNNRIEFTGVYTDSAFVTENVGCHSRGHYTQKFDIALCNSMLVMNMLYKDSTLQGEEYKVYMYKTN